MKTGGRKKGTPNKEKDPLANILRTHSMSYFEPKDTLVDGQPRMASDFDLDMASLTPDDRVNAELRLLEYHTPKKKAVDVDLSARVHVRTIEDELSALCGLANPDADGDDD